MTKKKFKDTRLAKFLKSKGSHIADFVGDVLPSEGILGIVKNVIDKDDTLPPQDKEEALKRLEFDLIEMQEVSKRWVADAKSDSMLSRNVRPLTLVFLTVAFVIGWYMQIEELEVVKELLTICFLAYFGGRSVEKFQKIKSS
tara:strand:- start:176 stop:601 length:426 start_codon:yes stop_codon:yes gene_type:complete